MSSVSPRRVFAALVSVVLAVSLLASCTDTPAPKERVTGKGVSSEPHQTKAHRSVTVNDVTGAVRLKAPATRIVALEWTYAEDLLALGIAPLGIADKAGYLRSVTAGPRPSKKVKDVGNRQEPDIKAITALKPDLIVTDNTRPPGRISQLRGIAPVLIFDPYRTDMTAWQEMRTTFAQLGKAVNRSDQAAAVLAHLDASVAAGNRTLAEAGKGEMPFALAQGFSVQGVPTIRMLTRISLGGEIVQRLGLQNAWKGKADRYGFSTVGVDELGSVSMADFLYVARKQDDPFAATFVHDEVWNDLEFVRSSRVHSLDPSTRLSGGPLSTEKCVREVVRALT